MLCNILCVCRCVCRYTYNIFQKHFCRCYIREEFQKLPEGKLGRTRPIFNKFRLEVIEARKERKQEQECRFTDIPTNFPFPPPVMAAWNTSSRSQYLKMGEFGRQNAHSTLNTDCESGV